MLRFFKILSAGAAIVSLASSALGQDAEPKESSKSIIFDFTTTQTSYSDSWIGGEAGSVNWVANLNTASTNLLSPKVELRSRLKLSFGQTLTQNSDTKDWSRPQKSTDLIDFESVAILSNNWAVSPYVAFRVETQFYDGRNINKKLFLSPMKFTESAGGTKKFYEKEKDFVISRLGIGIRQIITKYVEDTLTFSTSSETTSDAGIESISEADLPVHKNIRYNGKLSLFKAMMYSKSDDVKGTPSENYWKAVDVNFENGFTAAVTKIITVNLYLQLLYDKEISRKGRIKETLALGVTIRMI